MGKNLISTRGTDYKTENFQKTWSPLLNVLLYYSETVVLKVDLLENADDDLFAEWESARQIIRSRWMIISFVAFMWSHSARADPKSFRQM